MKGFIVYRTYRLREGKAYLQLFGRLENGESFVTINHARPYFYIKQKDLKQAKKIESFETEKSDFKNFDNENVVKIVLDVPSDVVTVRKNFEDAGIPCFEADIRFPNRFLIDKGIKSAMDIDGDYEVGETVDRVYVEPDLVPVKFVPKIKLLSIDIETNSTTTKILSISMVQDDYKKVFIVSKKKKLKQAIVFSSEKKLLEAFIEKVRDLDPDVITGWNVIDFDLMIIKERCKKKRIPFVLGRENVPSRIRVEKDFFRDSKADIPGRQVLDGLYLLRASHISLNDYRLNTAAKELLGDKKLIDFKFDDEDIMDIYDNNTQRLVDYNLKDSDLVVRILDKTKVLALAIEKSLITGIDLNRVNATIATLDLVYLRESIRKKIVLPSNIYETKEEQIKGAYVMESKPGIYDYILVLDFKSLYPTLMITFNIDPYDFVGKKKGKNYVCAPNGACFRNNDGILPKIIKDIMEHRAEAKKRKNEIASFALKTLLASFYGALGSPACRFFSMDMANAITAFARSTIKETAQLIELEGYEVIYSDTDSIFVVSRANSLDDANKIGKKIQKRVNEYYKKIIPKKYNRKSYLELEYEKCYIKFLMPMLRGSEKGAKKRYVGLLKQNGKEKLDFIGLEFVRRDWTELSKTFQLQLLDLIFHNKNVKNFVKTFVSDLNKGKYDGQLIYRKALRKPLNEYIKTTPPHVKAARKLKHLESNIIHYVLTTDGPEPIQNVKHPIDYNHYINKQIKPIADSVLVFFDLKFDDLVKGKTQKTLFNY